MVRQCDGRHTVIDGGMNKVLDAAGRIQEAVVRVIVQMDELWHWGSGVERYSREATWKNQEQAGPTYEHLVQRNGRAEIRHLMQHFKGHGTTDISTGNSCLFPQERFSASSFISVISSIA
jgi:hypothetical protein